MASSVLMRSGIRFAAVGAGVGLCAGIGYGVYQVRKGGSTPSTSRAALSDKTGADKDTVNSVVQKVEAAVPRKKELAERYPFVYADADFATEITELLQYRYIAPGEFDTVLSNSNQLIRLHDTVLKATEGKLSWPAMAQRYTSKAVDALRRLRKKVQERNGTLLLEVDEILKRIQKSMTDRNFNINMETNSKLDR